MKLSVRVLVLFCHLNFIVMLLKLAVKGEIFHQKNTNLVKIYAFLT